ncbi:hypothetical protein AB3N59_19365 [Leptospira sp. WS92.C1]
MCRLDPAILSHEAHLRLAWIHIKKYGIETAMRDICEQLKMFVEFHGLAEKYNQTLTIAATKVVYHFVNKSAADNFYEFIREYPQLKYNFKKLINSHYSIDIDHSEIAKKEYLEPDLLPFS